MFCVAQVLIKKTLNAVPCVAQDVRACEVVEFAGIGHERNEVALPFLHQLIDQAHRVEVRDVHVGGAMQDQQRPLETIDVRDW